MDRHAMINDALNQGTLMIFEHGQRAMLGELIKDRGDVVVFKIISGCTPRTGERITVRAASTTRITVSVLAEARWELGDITWRYADEADVMTAPVAKIITTVRRVYGSWAEAAACLV